MNLKVSTKYAIWLLVLYQFISVGLMSAGVWPSSFALINLGLGAIFILLVDSYAAVIYLILSIPFFITFPNFYSDTMSAWRVLFLWLFVVWFFKEWFRRAKETSHLAGWKSGAAGLKNLIVETQKKLFPWDFSMLLFGLVVLLSTAVARFKIQSLKQFLFFLNLYLFYIVVASVIKSREQILQIIKYTALSLGIIVTLGYLQFIATFFVPQYYFWQYWATMISRVYYGLSLSNILIYSNSWFSYSGKSPDLRMFSIMPDSHSFAMIAVFLIAYLLPLTYFYNKKELFRRESMPMLPNKINYFVWSAVRFSGLAVILSGTRGVWVGLLAPFFLTIVFYAKKISRPIVIKIFWAMAMIILLFMLSPLINMGLQTIRFSKYEENFLKRAASIYDLGEESNTNRILIWEQSLKYFAHHPQGVGAGNFVVTLLPDSAKNLPFKDIANLKNYRYNLPQKFVTAHSLYLNILVELGVLGALAFAFLIASYLWAVWSFIKQFGSESNLYTFFVINTAFTFVAFLAYGVFDVTLFNDKIMMYTLISLAISGVIITRYKEFKE